MSKCRVCSQDLVEKPLIQLNNMPKSAQFLPVVESLDEDKGIDLDVYQCSGCGLAQITNEPVPYYREVIRACGISKEMTEFRHCQFSEFIDKHSLHGEKIIEIGCGRGEYLSVMNKLKIEAYGLEYSSELVKACHGQGLNVQKGYIDNKNISLTSGPFDAFYMLSFLEHMPDPNTALRGVYNNLVDDGVGIVEVPNFNMILEKNLFSEFITDHLFYFTKETLTTTLNLNGFEVLDCGNVWHDYIISATVRKRPLLDISHFNYHQEKIKKEIHEYISNVGDEKIAVWGAGHQSLAVLSLTDLEDKVSYVVDSAPFKQGKYTPSTHIPIVAPDMLNEDPVGTVIVICGSYSDEVSKIIRQKHGKVRNVAVLRDYGLELAP